MKSSADTSPEIEALVRERLATLDGAQRVRMAASMFDTARTLAIAAVGDDRLALLDRLYPELRSDAGLRRRVSGRT